MDPLTLNPLNPINLKPHTLNPIDPVKGTIKATRITNPKSLKEGSLQLPSPHGLCRTLAAVEFGLCCLLPGFCRVLGVRVVKGFGFEGWGLVV